MSMQQNPLYKVVRDIVKIRKNVYNFQPLEVIAKSLRNASIQFQITNHFLPVSTIEICYLRLIIVILLKQIAAVFRLRAYYRYCSNFQMVGLQVMLNNLVTVYESLYLMEPPTPVSLSERRVRRSNYSGIVVQILRQWLEANANHPYPTEEEKQTLSTYTGLNMTQINNWFINARRRILPKIRSNGY